MKTSTTGSRSKRAKPSSADKALAVAAELAPTPSGCSLSDGELAGVEVKINRSPVMVLWATVRLK